MSLEFLLTSLVVVLTPGTGALFTVTAGLARGPRAAVVAAAGCTLATVLHALAALTGLAALLHTSATAFQVLKYAGVAYLLYLAWSTLRDDSPLAPPAVDTAPPSTARVIASAVLVNLLNPKLTIFFLAFLPQFVDPEDPRSTMHMAELSAVFTVMTFAVFVVYGCCAAAMRHHVLERPRVLAWLRRTFAAAFAALGVRLGFA